MREQLVGERVARRGRRLSLPVFYLLLAGVLVATIVKLSQPLGVLGRQQEELARLGAEKARLTAEMSRLEGRQHGLATDHGLERAARREGYIRPGERRLVFVPEKPAPEEADPPAPEE